MKCQRVDLNAKMECNTNTFRRLCKKKKKREEKRRGWKAKTQYCIHRVEMQISEAFWSSSGVLVYKQFRVYSVDYDLCWPFHTLIAVHTIRLYRIRLGTTSTRNEKSFLTDIPIFFPIVISHNYVDTTKIANCIFALDQCIGKNVLNTFWSWKFSIVKTCFKRPVALTNVSAPLTSFSGIPTWNLF